MTSSPLIAGLRLAKDGPGGAGTYSIYIWIPAVDSLRNPLLFILNCKSTPGGADPNATAIQILSNKVFTYESLLLIPSVNPDLVVDPEDPFEPARDHDRPNLLHRLREAVRTRNGGDLRLTPSVIPAVDP